MHQIVEKDPWKIIHVLKKPSFSASAGDGMLWFAIGSGLMRQ